MKLIKIGRRIFPAADFVTVGEMQLLFPVYLIGLFILRGYLGDTFHYLGYINSLRANGGTCAAGNAV